MSRALRVGLVFVGPVAAALVQLANYVLVYRAQATGSKLALHVATMTALAVTGAAAFGSYRTTRDSANEAERFLGALGALLGCLSLLVIAAFEVPNALLSPTD
jgi:hypothetical protein